MAGKHGYKKGHIINNTLRSILTTLKLYYLNNIISAIILPRLCISPIDRTSPLQNANVCEADQFVPPPHPENGCNIALLTFIYKAYAPWLAMLNLIVQKPSLGAVYGKPT